jgi:hypothetical protein
MLCYVHIPKTAGTAVHSALRQMMPAEEIYWIGSPAHPVEQWRRISPADLARFKVVGGHTNHRRLSLLCPGATFAALVRDPVDRAVSYFHFVSTSKGRQNVHWRRQLESHDLLSAIHAVPTFRTRISNAQCRAIAGTPSFAAAERAIEREDWIVEVAANIDRLLHRISTRFGWPQVKSEQRNAAAPGYFQRICTDDVARAIRDINQEDLQLVDKLRRLAKCA